MRVEYTKHALKKFRDLELLGILVTKDLVKKILAQPLDVVPDPDDSQNLISTGELDEFHVLRVVHRRER